MNADHSQAWPLVELDEQEPARTLLFSLGNPLARPLRALVFLHGPSGTGKTFLLKAATKKWEEEGPSFPIRWLTAVEFEREYGQAAKSGTTAQFVEQLAQQAVLVLDDFHALSRRPEPQRQLLQCVDQLLARNGRVLLAARAAPVQLSHVLPKLLNRLHGGYTFHLPLPSYFGRLCFLQHCAAHLPLTDSTLELLARPLHTSLRELAEWVRQLETTSGHASALRPEDLPASVRQAVTTLQRPTLARIAKATAAEFHLTVAELRSHSRARSLVRARQMAIYLARVLGQYPYARIARHFGLQHHSTAVHSVAQIHKLLGQDAHLRARLANVEARLRAK